MSIIHGTANRGVITPMKVFAYLSTPSNTIASIANRWYVFKGVFTNTFNDNFTLSSDGIIANISGYVEISWMMGGVSDKAGDIKIGIVRNGTFTVDGNSMSILDSAENILPGSGGKMFADTVGAVNGEINPRCCWAGYINSNDKFTLVISSTVNTTTIVPDGASASLHSII